MLGFPQKNHGFFLRKMISQGQHHGPKLGEEFFERLRRWIDWNAVISFLRIYLYVYIYTIHIYVYIYI